MGAIRAAASGESIRVSGTLRRTRLVRDRLQARGSLAFATSLRHARPMRDGGAEASGSRADRRMAAD